MRPLALSLDGESLYAVNTPDGRLEIFDVDAGGLTHRASVPVGLEPVAVAARTESEVWVVNHLSDSVSIVDVSGPPRVTRTLLVGDEPRDIVFAGPRSPDPPTGGPPEPRGAAPTRAFVTTAHRGQNRPGDPQLTTPGIGRADVWVFDVTDPGWDLGGEPIEILTLFGDTPRALAVSGDGQTVYAAVFHSGNRTTSLNEGVVCDRTSAGLVAGPCEVFGEIMPGGLPLPLENHAGVESPESGLIVKFDPAAGIWADELGRDWSPAVRFDLPDLDVFAIDAMATPPVQKGSWAGVGTVLFNMTVNPTNGVLYVSNTEARNEVRFEGPGSNSTTVRGRLHEARISLLDPSGVRSRHLNKHIDYSTVPQPAGAEERSLATPLGMAVSNDGRWLYVAAFGSGRIGVLETAALEDDSFVPDASSHITLSGGGPTGLVIDRTGGFLFAMTRFDNAISVIALDRIGGGTEIDHIRLPNPEPARVIEGRPFLYDARLTSSNGEASCSACHVFADFDSLAWDLGNPDGDETRVRKDVDVIFHHPQKGPMTTQTLRGLANHGRMHWRGDRFDLDDPGDEVAAFMAFNGAFESLIGRDEGPLTDAEMRSFADFVLEIASPPNPIRSLDNSLTASQARGRQFFEEEVTARFAKCATCHVLDPSQGFFGTDGRLQADGMVEVMKTPHLRNLYQKVGMFGMPAVARWQRGDNQHRGPQIRGFGYNHDGSVDTVFRFLRLPDFSFPVSADDENLPGDAMRRDIEAFLLAFDNDLAPIVGQQVTLNAANAQRVEPRVDLLEQRADAPYPRVDAPDATECDLVVKGGFAGEARGWLRTSSGMYQGDRAEEPPISGRALRELARQPGQELTFTCVPPGSGVRMGLDRDGDGRFDRDEIDAGLDPSRADRPEPPSSGGTDLPRPPFPSVDRKA